jgi:NAD(P)-dependent dehydrogenase (short-subunit alcohol dehydrogenase family)
MPFPGLGAYTSSKAALETYSFTVASEVKSFGVEVAVVVPGLFRTPAFGAAPRAPKASSPTSAYRHALPRVEADIDKMMKIAPEPQGCADGIADLCEAQTVRFRNIIGADAWRAFFVYHLVPTDWMLKLIGRVFGRMLLLE